MMLAQGDTAWMFVRDLPYQRSSLKAFFIDAESNLFIVSNHAIEKGRLEGASANVQTGLLANALITSSLRNDAGIIFVGTDRGLFWSNDDGGKWQPVKGEIRAQHLTEIRRLNSTSIIAVTLRGAYICVSRADRHSDITVSVSLNMRTEGKLQEVLIDDGLSDLTAVEMSADGVMLRGDNSNVRALTDGLHKITVKTAAAARSAAYNAYVYKEAAKARLFRPYDKSYAVIVAASGRWDPADFSYLDSAIPQAKELESFLVQQGFQVKGFYEEDATADNIRSYLNVLEAKLTDQDRVLFYFSGHGVTIPGALGNVGYLLTYPATVSTVREKGIPMSRLEGEYAGELTAKHVMFLLDACFSGLALQTRAPKSEEMKVFQTYEKIATFTKNKARDILVASEGDQAALDQHGGLFTRAVLEGLRGGADYGHDGVITAEQLSVYVQQKVVADAATRFAKQLPRLEELKAYGDGQFVFLSK